MPRLRVKIQISNTTEAITCPIYIDLRIPASVSMFPVFVRVEGTNRNINVSLATIEARKSANPRTPDDPDLLLDYRTHGSHWDARQSWRDDPSAAGSPTA